MLRWNKKWCKMDIPLCIGLGMYQHTLRMFDKWVMITEQWLTDARPQITTYIPSLQLEQN